MADTLNNISIAEKTWVDLYAASGITVGTQIICQNLGTHPVMLCVKATEPANTDAVNVFAPLEFFNNKTGDSGAWAYCESKTLISVAGA